MATTTSHFHITKPALSDAVSALTLANNILLIEALIARIKNSIEPDPALLLHARSTSIGSIPTDTTWHGYTTSWSAQLLKNGAQLIYNNSSDRQKSVVYDSGGYFGFVRPGYFRVSLQISMTMSGTTANYGSARAMLALNNTYNDPIPHAFAQSPLNVYTTKTIFNLDTILKVVEQNYTGTDYDLMVHGDNTGNYWTTSATLLDPDNTFRIYVGQTNDAALTATLNSVDTYMLIEYVRPV